jgi:hypothetical protein
LEEVFTFEGNNLEHLGRTLPLLTSRQNIGLLGSNIILMPYDDNESLVLKLLSVVNQEVNISKS